MVTVDDVRAVLAGLPRSSEVLVRDRVKFRVGQIVYVAFSQDETEIGFAFPKEQRAAVVAARPAVFFLPRESELRFHWIEAWLDALDADEMRELVLDAWRMVVPKRVAREVLGDRQDAEMTRPAVPDQLLDPDPAADRGGGRRTPRSSR